METNRNDVSTARPWRQGDDIGSPARIYAKREGSASAYVACAHSGACYTSTDVANARLIVRAVNAHEALCEALAALERAYMLTVHPDPSAMEIALLERARTALKLARGEG